MSLNIILADETPPYAEDYVKITSDGAWCWFSDPRAIYSSDHVIGGYVNKEGSIIAFNYAPSTQEKSYYTLHEKLEYDDHANPSFLELPDKKIISFYSSHSKANAPIYYRVTRNPGDISAWEEEQSITPESKGSMGICYTNPACLTDENNRVYLLYRGTDYKPNIVYSDDLKTWSKGQTLISSSEQSKGRPYLKAANNGKDTIFMAFTDGHPRNEPTNSIYFVKYKNGQLLTAGGKMISTLQDAPVSPANCDIVYDAKSTMDKAWIWDVAFDKDENPVIVYARFSNASGIHSYWYARWDGQKWHNHKITDAGIWFQRNNDKKEKPEHENNYSGGVYLDHENPSIVYTSRPIKDIFEIEKWETANGGAQWTSTPITKESQRDNVRPFVIRNHKGDQPSVMWMYNYNYPQFTAYDCAIRINQKAKPESSEFKKDAVLSISRKVADWQIKTWPSQWNSRSPENWTNGPMYLGLFYFGEVCGDQKYDKWLQQVFNRQAWQVGKYMYHADYICIGQPFLDMYMKHKDKNMLIPTKARADWVIENRITDPELLIHGKSRLHERWSWCDALFMAPPVYARLYSITGDKKYMEFADSEFKATYERLYNKEDRLFYRDDSYITQREANGKNIYWGRGNGWVMGGLAELLKNLPEDDKTYRPFYEKLLVEMSERLLELQQADGFWKASLLDPESYPSPETSATGFIAYGLAYGINCGLLPKEKYLPAVKRGWTALVNCVDTEGKLCWVQPVGADPKHVKKHSTDVYGTGAFLMTAAEIYKLSE